MQRNPSCSSDQRLVEHPQSPIPGFAEVSLSRRCRWHVRPQPVSGWAATILSHRFKQFKLFDSSSLSTNPGPSRLFPFAPPSSLSVRSSRYTLAIHGTRILTTPVDLHLSHHRTKPDEAKKIRQNGECPGHARGWERRIKNTARNTSFEKRRGRKRARKDMGYERGR
jgi:hypothetical protein